MTFKILDTWLSSFWPRSGAIIFSKKLVSMKGSTLKFCRRFSCVDAMPRPRSMGPLVTCQWLAKRSPIQWLGCHCEFRLTLVAQEWFGCFCFARLPPPCRFISMSCRSNIQCNLSSNVIYLALTLLSEQGIGLTGYFSGESGWWGQILAQDWTHLQPIKSKGLIRWIMSWVQMRYTGEACPSPQCLAVRRRGLPPRSAAHGEASRPLPLCRPLRGSPQQAQALQSCMDHLCRAPTCPACRPEWLEGPL